MGEGTSICVLVIWPPGQFLCTFCCTVGDLVAKKLYSFRFNAEQYTSFKKLTAAKSLTATEAFERFMNVCLEADDLVFRFLP